MTTFAGVTTSGYIDGSLSAARFNGPFALTFNTDESILYVADTFNHVVRTISSSLGAFMIIIYRICSCLNDTLTIY